MAGTLYRHEPSVWQAFHQKFALVEGHGLILFSPDDKHRARVLAHALVLIAMVYIGIGSDFRESSPAKHFDIHMFLIAFRPVGNPIGMNEILHMIVSQNPRVE